MRYQKVMKIGLFGLLIMSLLFLTGCFGAFTDWFAPLPAPPHEITADAGPDQTVEPNTLVTLDGSASHNPYYRPLTFQWTQTAGPEVFLCDPTIVDPTFTPAETGTYTFQLKVTVGKTVSTPDYVIIIVADPLLVSITHTTDLDFGGGALADTAVVGTGEPAGVELASTFELVWTHISSSWLPVGVGWDAAPAFADIDNDGDFDLAVGDGGGLVEYFENTGTITSPAWTHRSSNWLPVGVGWAAAPAFADIDNDGDFDLVVGSVDVVMMSAKAAGVTNPEKSWVEYFRNDVEKTYSYSGTFISSAIDTGQNSDFTTLDFTITKPAGTDLKFQLRTATTEADLATAPWLGPDGTNATFYEVSGTTINPIHDDDRWIQYKAFFSTTDTTVTPNLADITISFYPSP